VNDWVLFALFFSAYLINKNALPAMVAYSFCLVYQITLFDYHSAVLNHVIYAVIFIPAAFFATITKSFKYAYAICGYSLFHALYAIDWAFSGGYETVFSIYYYYAQAVLAIGIIYFSFEKGNNERVNRGPLHNFSILDHLWYFQTHTKKSGRA
jgi:glucan phosphoethanolaminetransferase (alkaline phosphatase superfamily)